MAEAALVREKVQAGAWLVRAADAGKVPLRAALWVYDSTEDQWTLVLESKPEKDMGPREFSTALHAAVAAMKNVRQRNAAQDLLLRDVVLFTRPHPIAERLRPSLGKAKSVARTRLGNTTVGGYIVEGAVLYRLESAQTL